MTLEHTIQDAASAAAPLRVLVVDDSALQRGMLVSLLDSDAELQVVGIATNGQEAVQTAARLKPDVITMDLRMPVLDGLESARLIMQKTPTPIVMVSGDTTRDDARMATQAFEVGILAVVQKPTTTAGPGAAELLRTVKSMARVKVIRRWSTDRMRAPALPPEQHRPVSPSQRPAIIAIGASTGGPQVLHQVIKSLPGHFPIPIVVVQHIAPGFAEGLVEWLRGQCALPIQIATSGQRLQGRGICIAPTGQHLVVRGSSLHLLDTPAVAGHRPSATVLFQSVAQEFRGRAVGILLTGMGDDGASGLADLKRAGGITIAQDEASSVVFGMPAAAINMGIVDHVLSPAEISNLLIELAGRTQDHHGI